MSSTLSIPLLKLTAPVTNDCMFDAILLTIYVFFSILEMNYTSNKGIVILCNITTYVFFSLELNEILLTSA